MFKIQKQITLTDFVNSFSTYFRTKMAMITGAEKRNYELLAKFLEVFAPQKIPAMTLEDYCFAKGKKETMCYWLDNTLNDLGDIHISGQCGYQKFGIQNIGGEYVFKRRNQHNCKYGDNKDAVYKTINSELQKVIEGAVRHDVKAIEESILPEVLKAKLAYLYSKEKWIPIYVKPDVETLLKLFGVGFDKRDSLTKKREKLYAFYLEVKTQVPFITTWEFMHFIYSIDGYRHYLRKDKTAQPWQQTAEKEGDDAPDPLLKDDENEDEIEFSDEDLDYFVGTYTKNRIPDPTATKIHRQGIGPKKTDYQKRQKANEKKGEIGEKLILRDESIKLLNMGIVSKAIRESLTDDTLGYDISSFDDKGKPIVIEVKTTTTSKIDGFYLSVKETEKAIELGERYRLYRVYNLNFADKTYDVEIFTGEELFDRFKLKETGYRAELQ